MLKSSPSATPRCRAASILFATAKLLDYAARSDALLASTNPFALITLAHLRTRQTRHDADELYAAKWQLTKLLYQQGWSKQRIITMFKVINWMMALPVAHQQRYWQALLDLHKEQKMKNPMLWVTPLEEMFMDKGREQGLERGLEQGLEQGLERGRREGARLLLERQLARRFGPLSQTTRRKLAKADLATLEAWSDQLPDAQSLRQIFAAAPVNPAVPAD